MHMISKVMRKNKFRNENIRSELVVEYLLFVAEGAKSRF